MVDRSIDRLLEYAPMPRARVCLFAAICAAGLLTGCAGKKSSTRTETSPNTKAQGIQAAGRAQQQKPNAPVQSVPQSVPPAAAPTPKPETDPLAELIAFSNTHFETAQRELKAGHPTAAKAEFDRAVAVLVESPERRAEPRLREHLDQLLERIAVAESAV